LFPPIGMLSQDRASLPSTLRQFIFLSVAIPGHSSRTALWHEDES
jgi:hypothetical protein